MKDNNVVLLSHGGGGLRTGKLIRDVIVRHLGNPILNELDDGANILIPEKNAVFTTDSFVVNPLFFPGGDIGKLAVCGTVNDLAMMGAEPRCLSLSLIIEEGLPLNDLERIIVSVRKTLKTVGVNVVTGDTKVVERGMGFGLFINTAGIGVRLKNADPRVANARAGDVIIVTGPLGDHGAAVISCREGIKLESKLVSDVAPLWNLVACLAGRGVRLHCLRDPTRGGLAAALVDIAASSKVGIRIVEKDLPVREEVRGICALLGMDPLNMACEGRAVIVCPRKDGKAVMASLKSHPLGRQSRLIGCVAERPAGMVILETRMGGERIIEMPMGEDLPRIC